MFFKQITYILKSKFSEQSICFGIISQNAKLNGWYQPSWTERMGITMIQAGYMYKKIVARPESLACENVTKIYSVSHCTSEDFTNYIPYWKHNKYWFFNDPKDMDIIIDEQKIKDEFELLFYELYEKEFDEEEQSWQEIIGEESFGYDVKSPLHKDLLGFDIVSYSIGTSHECSPLSCNSLCTEVKVNENCLLDDLAYAIEVTESLNEKKAEPGPYRIIAVNRISKIS